MISEKAKNLLYYLVSRYQDTGINDFSCMDFKHIDNYEKSLVELCNESLMTYDDSHVADCATLTNDGINYNF